MTIQKVSNYLIYGVAADTKPTTSATNTLFVEQDTGKMFRYTGTAWALLQPTERAGTATASGTGSATSFNVAHGMGTTPYAAFIQCSSHSTAITYTYDATNIAVTFVTAPPSGTNNVIFQWRALA